MAAKKNKYSNKDSAPASGISAHLGLALGLAGAGLLVAFGLVWWQAIVQPQQALADAQRKTDLTQFAQTFDSRIVELQAMVNAIATSPQVEESMSGYDAASRAQLESQLSHQHPNIVRVALIEKGKAEVDLNAAVPISFAALDLIRRAETQPFVGPEVSLNQRNLIYAAQPVTPQGMVSGVILVVFDTDFFLGPLAAKNPDNGVLQVEQKFAGNPSTVVMQWGNEERTSNPINKTLVADHWTLSYSANHSGGISFAGAGGLILPFCIALLSLLGGVYVAFSRFGRNITEDAETLTTQIERGGARAQPRSRQI